MSNCTFNSDRSGMSNSKSCGNGVGSGEAGGSNNGSSTAWGIFWFKPFWPKLFGLRKPSSFVRVVGRARG